MAKQSRIRWLDIARGICILCMITVHFSAWTGRIPIVNIYTGTWFLLFFFFSSGLCWQIKSGWGSYLGHQARKLLLPYTVVTCFSICIRIQRQNLWQDLDSIERLVRGVASLLYALPTSFEAIPPFGLSTVSVGPIWFLPCLFVACLLYRLLCYAPQRLRLPLATVLCLLSAWSQQLILLPFTLQNAGIGCFFVALGCACKPFLTRIISQLRQKSILRTLLLWVVSFLALSAALLLLPWQILDLGSNLYCPLSFVSTCCGFCFVICLALLLDRIPYLSSLFSFFGQQTLTILLLHTIDIDILRDWGGEHGYLFLLGTFLLYGLLAYALQWGKRVWTEHRAQSFSL